MEQLGGPPAEDRLLAFYEGSGTDDAGRSFDAVLSFSAALLEAEHDYIQWLFPLPEPSPYNPGAPVLTERVIQAFLSDVSLRWRLRKALECMLAFYGLVLRANANGPPVVTAPDWSVRSKQWLRMGDHNHLRLTRILRSCHLLGLAEDAEALGGFLDDLAATHPAEVSEVTRGFWARASRGLP